MATLSRLADELEFPIHFFFRGDAPTISADAASFRALSTMTITKRDQALAAGALAADLASWIDGRFDLPDPDVPRFASIDPDRAAELVRNEWGLGEGAAPNMIYLVEAHGVRVFSISDDYADVNAYSLWRDGVPFMFLNTLKSAENGRFDVAHELGHLVLHGHHEAPRGREYEHEANLFASAFLMPRGSVLASRLAGATLPTIIQAKRRWGVSAMALIVRLHAVGLITDWHYRSLCVEAGKSGYRKQEPAPMPRESSQLLQKVFGYLRSEGLALSNVADALGITKNELERLVFGLVPTAVGGGGEATSDGRASLRLVRP
jgi:Zn-dependent peptidase ImmA (M78 family)